MREISAESFRKYYLERSKRKENLTLDRRNNDKRRRKKKREDKVFLLHELFNFAIPCLVILNCVTSDELSIHSRTFWTRLAFATTFSKRNRLKWNKHVFPFVEYFIPSIGRNTREIFLSIATKQCNSYKYFHAVIFFVSTYDYKNG